MSLTADEYRCWWSEAGERELRQLLYWRWDPIGVAEAFPTTEGEYDDYTGPVLTALRQGKSAKQIGETLRRIEREQMGFRRRSSHTDVGQAIVTWFRESQRQWKAIRDRTEVTRPR